jgi:serine/threonine-protein kinase RsbT
MAPSSESIASDAVVVPVSRDVDVVTARQEGRRLAASVGFSVTDLTLIATAISELARNILEYAGHGEIRLRLVDRSGRSGIEVVASDDGPGIADLDRALEDGFSTRGSLGLGLPGTRRLMDDFDIDPGVGTGVTVTVCKWVPAPRR